MEFRAKCYSASHYYSLAFENLYLTLTNTYLYIFVHFFLYYITRHSRLGVQEIINIPFVLTRHNFVACLFGTYIDQLNPKFFFYLDLCVLN